MPRRKRLLLVLAVLVGVVSLAAGVWLYRQAFLTDEEQQYVGTWTRGPDEVWEIRPGRTLIVHQTDPNTRKPVTREFRWSVRRKRLFLRDPDEVLPFSTDPIKDVVYTYEIVAVGPDRLSIRDTSDVVTELTRQGAR